MRRSVTAAKLLLLLVLVFVAAARSGPQAQQAPAQQPAAAAPATPVAPVTAPAAAGTTASTPRAFLDTYCVTCHNNRLKTGGLALDGVDVTQPARSADVWEKVHKKLNAGAMPPAGARRPAKAQVDAFLGYLSTSLDSAATATPNPGRSMARRLNRTEYANAIRDLLGLTVDASVLLPPDDEGYGFDNIADQLKMSPLLLERYLSAAWNISHIAVGDPALRPEVTTYRVRGDASQRTVMAGLPLGTQGGMTVKHYFPLDGEYEIRVRLWRTAFENAEIRGLDEERQVEYLIDGERVFLGQFGGAEDLALDRQSHAEAATAVEGRLRTRVPVKAGERTITIAFLKKSDALSVSHEMPFERSNSDVLNATGVAHLDRFSIAGPYGTVEEPDTTVSRQRIFTCTPARPRDEEACAKRIVSTLARRAYRRPVTDRDVAPLVESYQAGRQDATFELGIARALRSILTNPEFLFRIESDPERARPNEVYRTSDLQMASRLSFFLWSSIPDDVLLDAAASGKLKSPAEVERQVKRMLADPKAEAFVRNFAGQWLQLRNLRNHAPDPQAFPDFDDNLRQAMQRETELFFGSIVREDRSLMELLTANYSFINDRLARHYGIQGIVGSEFQRVTLANPARWGILGKASTLTVTSYVTRTSPVVRGKWILSQLLGTPPAPPPPDVPLLTENGDDGRKLTLRQRMEEHRRNPACASCHRLMDPPGFALENFNAIGQWRTLGEDGTPIDSAGELVDGTKVDGVVALRNAIASRPDLFVGTVTEKIMTYALGRGIEPVDMPAVRKVVREASTQNYRFSSVILGVVNSLPFQMRRVAERTPATLEARQ